MLHGSHGIHALQGLERATGESVTLTAPTLLPDKSHRVKLSINKYSLIRSAISPLFVIGRQFREYVYCGKKNVKVLFKTFAWLAIRPFYELKKCVLLRDVFTGCVGFVLLF